MYLTEYCICASGECCVLSRLKRGELLIPSAERYTYDISLLDKNNVETGEIRERVSHQQLLRSKSLWARNVIRVFLKNSCAADHERLTVKKELVEKLGLDHMCWDEVFGGPVAEFPRTPLMHRGPSKGSLRPPPLHLNGQTMDDFDAQYEADFVNITEKEKKRKRTKKTDLENKSIEEKKEEKRRKKESIKNEKKKRAIAQQQEELEGLFEQARKLSIDDLSRWEQDERLLTGAEIVELKQLIRQTKEKIREEKRLAKQREKEALLEWKKPRDDVACDDLQPLPEYAPLRLPIWMSDDDFGDHLFIFQFFQSFAELLPIREVHGTSNIKFAEIVSAIRSPSPDTDDMFAQLMHILLKAKTERADEEDGDEGDF
ncbi:unnamed protein product [Gongylonema pulchrum]|uniref:DDT domain-containing protein n=1 Tax=Gongylonema pulchrum TaxID=637853 RepID=A0A3P7MVK3_9BILA|nr:unnamed protein product [Gongylonema pulchrum]